MKILIACSSSDEIPEKYMTDCKEYINALLQNNDLVFGAYNGGLMGMSYDITLKNKNNVIGVCPEAYKEDFKNLKCTKEITTNSVSERTKLLFESSDALVFLPGGIGTIYELFTSLESKRCHEFDKPIIIYNSCGYFNELFLFLDKIYKEKFTKEYIKEQYYITNSVEDTINYINKYYSKERKVMKN